MLVGSRFKCVIGSRRDLTVNLAALVLIGVGGACSPDDAVVCGAPPVVAHTAVPALSRPTPTSGATATYVCDAGYDGAGLVATCGHDATWSPTPVCAPVDCGAPPSVDGATSTVAGGAGGGATTTFGATATYDCGAGRRVRGAAPTCGADRKWSAAPTCEFVDCGPAPVVPHASEVAVSGGGGGGETTTFGARAVATCRPGYRATGVDATCGASGQWSPPVVCSPQLAVGPAYACFIDAENAVRCWGKVVVGTTTGTFNVPEGLHGSAVAALDGGACVIALDGNVTCWGDAGVASMIPTGLHAIGIAAGSHFACAIQSDGAVTCWGATPFGGTVQPSVVPAGLHAVWLSAAQDHACALDAGGRVHCWLVYDGTFYEGPGNARDVVASADGDCAIVGDGVVDCFASGSTLPMDRKAVEVFPRVSSSGCVLDTDGVVACGQDGDVLVGGGALALAGAGGDLCALVDRGGSEPEVTCFGQAAAYLGAPLRDVAMDGVGCTVRDDRSVACWTTGGEFSDDPPAGLQAKRIAAAIDFACAIDQADHVQCWGIASRLNEALDQAALEVSELDVDGIEHMDDEELCVVTKAGPIRCWEGDPPVVVPVPSDLRGHGLSVERGNACVIGEDAKAHCWDLSGAAVPSTDATGLTALSVSHQGGCAIGTGGAVTCWGQVAAPPAGLQATAVAVGWTHACALDDAGRPVCWGAGDAATAPDWVQPARAISAGDDETCAIRLDGVLECWGLFEVLGAPF